MAETLLIHLKYCLTPATRVNNAAIVVRDGRILAVGGYSAFVQTDQFHVIEMPDCYALPGFVDTRIYGAGGFDSMHAHTDRNIGGMSRTLASHGVTSFLPTTQSADPRRLKEVVAALADLCDQPVPGAVPVGIHIEGPFISPKKRGAHPPQHIRPIDLAEARELLAAGKGKIKIFTYAPELDQALELTALLCTEQVIACLGHTVASEQAVKACLDAGASRCSHLYNGMDPLKNRDLGLAAIALTDERVWVELIPDGVHCHPGMVDLACRCKSKERLIAISNSMEAAGMESGIYKLGEDIIHVRDGKAALEDGTLAGSVSLLDQNYRHLMRFTHLTQNEAAACVTVNPARSIGLDDRGEIKPGRRADLVILNDKHQVLMTLVAGQIVFRAPTGERLHERPPVASPLVTTP